MRKIVTDIKCFDCKYNARLGFGNVVPLCMITGLKQPDSVTSCKHHDRVDPNDGRYIDKKETEDGCP